MITIAHLLLLASVAGTTPAVADETRAIQATVDPRVELMSIIFRLAGHPEYNQPNSASDYADDVEDQFGKFRDHPVVQTARRLRGTRGVSYDAVMSMAMHIEDTDSLKERIPFDQKPPRLDDRWRADEAREFLQQARDFVKEAKFNEFFKQHQKLYAAAGERMTAQLAKRDYIGWFDSYFGARPKAKFQVVIGMLNGGSCYGSGIRFPDGSEEIIPIIGAWKFDDEGVPAFDDSFTSTIVHEFCHSYTNAIVDKYADELEPAGQRIFSHCAAAMKQQAYGNWKTMMYESLVRVSVVRYLSDADGPVTARREIREQHDRGFEWIGDLSKLLGEYESNRGKYKTFDDFMPRVVEFFNAYADKYEGQAAKAPKVVSMTPANGAEDVDPGLTEITIVFDRPMQDGAWSVVGGGPHFPEITGKVHYDKECKVLTLPVKLKPNWSYQFWLNRGKYNSFQSKDGVKLESVAVTFETRPE